MKKSLPKKKAMKASKPVKVAIVSKKMKAAAPKVKATKSMGRKMAKKMYA